MQLCGSLSILWHCLSLGLEWKLTFSSGRPFRGLVYLKTESPEKSTLDWFWGRGQNLSVSLIIIWVILILIYLSIRENWYAPVYIFPLSGHKWLCKMSPRPHLLTASPSQSLISKALNGPNGVIMLKTQSRTLNWENDFSIYYIWKKMFFRLNFKLLNGCRIYRKRISFTSALRDLSVTDD